MWAARIGVAAIAVVAAPAAHAHAVLVAVVPASGADVRASPQQLLLRFHGPIDVPPGAVRLVDGSGRPVRLGAITHPTADSVSTAPAQPLQRGKYTLVWHLASASHPVDGRSSFSVGAPARGELGIALMLCLGVAALALPLGVAARSTRLRVPIALGALLVLALPFAPRIFLEQKQIPPSGYFTTATRLGPFGLEVGVSPDAPGTNTIDLLVTDRSGRRAELGSISVTAAHARSAPVRFRAEQLAPGHFAVDLARFTSPGIWQLRIGSRPYERTISLPVGV